MPYMHNKSLVPYARELRKEMTKEERKLWTHFLRIYPVRFRRQKIIGKYIVDFYCAAAHLAVELDGSQHFDDENIKKDAERTEFLKKYGVDVIRVTNIDITRNFDAVCRYIDNEVEKRIHPSVT